MLEEGVLARPPDGEDEALSVPGAPPPVEVEGRTLAVALALAPSEGTAETEVEASVVKERVVTEDAEARAAVAEDEKDAGVVGEGGAGEEVAYMVGDALCVAEAEVMAEAVALPVAEGGAEALAPVLALLTPARLAVESAVKEAAEEREGEPETEELSVGCRLKVACALPVPAAGEREASEVAVSATEADAPCVLAVEGEGRTGEGEALSVCVSAALREPPPPIPPLAPLELTKGDALAEAHSVALELARGEVLAEAHSEAAGEVDQSPDALAYWGVGVALGSAVRERRAEVEWAREGVVEWEGEVKVVGLPVPPCAPLAVAAGVTEGEPVPLPEAPRAGERVASPTGLPVSAGDCVPCSDLEGSGETVGSRGVGVLWNKLGVGIAEALSVAPPSVGVGAAALAVLASAGEREARAVGVWVGLGDTLGEEEGVTVCVP